MRQALLVTNNPIFTSTITTCLQNEQFHVSTACDGKQVDRLLNQSHFDLVISEVCVPLTNGYELLQNICSRQSGSVVVMVAAIQNEQAVSQYYKLGANLFLSHPIDPMQMMHSIRQLLAVEHNEAA